MITWKNKKHLIFIQESILKDNQVTNNFHLINHAEKFLFYIANIQNIGSTHLILANYDVNDEILHKQLSRCGVDCFLQNLHIDNINSNNNTILQRQSFEYWQSFINANDISPQAALLFVDDLLTGLYAASFGMEVIALANNDLMTTHSKIDNNLKKYQENLKYIKNFTELMPQKITFTDFIDAQTIS